jgi:hypothetical protein
MLVNPHPLQLPETRCALSPESGEPKSVLMCMPAGRFFLAACPAEAVLASPQSSTLLVVVVFPATAMAQL